MVFCNSGLAFKLLMCRKEKSWIWFWFDNFLGSGCLEIRIFGFPIQNKWGKFDFVPMKNIIVLIIVLKIFM